MELYRIAEALSVVLEINDDSTAREAGFHLTCNGTNINIDIHPDEDRDHVFYFTSHAQFNEYEMEEARWSDDALEPAVLDRKRFNSFAEMLAAVKEVGRNEQGNVQTHRRRCGVSRTSKTKA